MRRFRSRWAAPSAFTLIELLIVILVIGILIAVAAPSFLGQTQKAEDSAAKQNITVAYKAAKAFAVDGNGALGHVQGDFDGFDAGALEAMEPGMVGHDAVTEAGPVTCPDDAAGQPHNHIYIAAAAGNNLTICNDPGDRVWVLKVINGVFHSPKLYLCEEGVCIEQGQPQNGSSASESSGGTDVGATSASGGAITIDFGTADAAPDGETNVTPAITVTDPAAPAGQSNTVAITIDAGDLPDGTTTSDINVYADGDPVPDCTTTAPANPDPCVSSVANGSGGSIVVTIKDNGGSSTTYTVTSSAGGGGGCTDGMTGDVPNNASGAPANDDFCHARVLSGDSGVYNGTSVGSTVQQSGATWREMAGGNNDYQNFGQNFWGEDVAHSVWFTWTAPTSGHVTFSTLGSPDYDQDFCDSYFDTHPYTDRRPPVLGAFDSTDWDVIGNDLYNSWNHVVGGPVTTNVPGAAQGGCGNDAYHTEVGFNATADTQYVIWFVDENDWDVGGQYRISWSMP